MGLLEKATNKLIDRVRDERVRKAEADRDMAAQAMIQTANNAMSGTLVMANATASVERHRMATTIRELRATIDKERLELIPLRAKVLDLEEENTRLRDRLETLESGESPYVGMLNAPDQEDE